MNVGIMGSASCIPLCWLSEENVEFASGCGAVSNMVAVNPSGNVRPCSHFSEEFAVGNLYENSLESIFEKMNFWLDESVIPVKGECSRCSAKDTISCKTGCKVYTIFENAELFNDLVGIKIDRKELYVKSLDIDSPVLSAMKKRIPVSK